MTPGLPGGRLLPTQVSFRRHVLAYVAATSALLIAEFVTGVNLWMFWPMLIWGGTLAVHYFVAGALDADDDWAEERVQDLRHSSYDFDHIGSIEKRVREGDPSVTPHTERDRNGR